MMKVIDSFVGKYDFLSNFYMWIFEYRGCLVKSAEHAYQASKTNKMKERKEILKQLTPGKAKRLGRKATLKSCWEEIKINVMKKVLKAKFKIPILRYWLLDTEDAELIEGNNWGDTFWGMCKGKGENHLGKLLMEVRGKIRKGKM